MRATRRSAPRDRKTWFRADQGEVHRYVFEYVAEVERAQFELFDRFEKLEALYDPNAPNNALADHESDPCALVQENVVATNVDTVTAVIAAADIRARVMTDGADWAAQRRARALELYGEEVCALVERDAKARKGFKAAAKKGTGLAKVYATSYGEVRVDVVRVDDIIVDEAECRSGGTPRQMHHRIPNADREELKALFPEHEEDIERAQRGTGWTTRRWAGYRPLQHDELVVIESWKLPIGRPGRPGYRPGRHTITIDGCDLLDEEWLKPYFPIACMVWSDRDGWYGISLAERIAGIQRALNKRNWQIDRNLDQYAVPTTYVDMADARLSVQTINRIGTVVVHRGKRPETVFPTATSPEMHQNRREMKLAASEESGVNQMAMHGTKPPGLDSGEALRQYKDQTTQRFSQQEKAYEQFVLDITWLVLDVCKDLGDDAPVVVRRSRFGARKIKWADVDMGELRVQLHAASRLSRTPAGRTQFILDLAQAGVISKDAVPRLINHPDVERELSLYRTAIESIEMAFDEIADGKVIVPDPMDNPRMIIWRGERQYLQWQQDGAPEEVLEVLRQYTVLAAWYVAQAEGAVPENANIPAAAQLPGDMPQLPAGPAPTQPVSALAPEAGIPAA